MDVNILKILEAVADGSLSPTVAEKQIGTFSNGIADLGHTKLDLDRHRRRGIAEAIYCQGKSPQQIFDIAREMDAHSQTILCTRVSPEAAETVRASFPELTYDEMARVLYKKNQPGSAGHGSIAVLTAGTTDIPVAEEAALCLEIWGNTATRIFDVGVAGLHRLLSHRDAIEQATVLIVVAGMEGALPAVVAGLVRAPVIAVPTSVGYGACFGGATAMLGMLSSCSGGIATVNIDNGFGAALLAHMINHVGLDSNLKASS